MASTSRDAAQVLLALRRTSMAELERRVDLAAPPEVARLGALEGITRPRPRRAARQASRRGSTAFGSCSPCSKCTTWSAMRWRGCCPTAGAEVILLGANTSIDGIVRAATEEDADAIVLGVYNGNALALGEHLARGAREDSWRGRIFMGGILNQDTGEGLPIDARPALECSRRVLRRQRRRASRLCSPR